jgi:alanine dehydrogenase
MRVGVPKEVKDGEYRVGLVPSTVRELTANGHEVIVERNAGLGAGSPMPTTRRSGRRSFLTPTKSMPAPS